MKTITLFDEDGTLTAAHDGKVVTNRSATGPITLTIEDGLAAGTELEIHQVEPYAITVTGSSTGDDLLGQGQQVTLNAQGSSLYLVLTGPHCWTGR